MTVEEREHLLETYAKAWSRADHWAAAMRVPVDVARDAIQQVAVEILEGGPMPESPGVFLSFARHRLRPHRAWMARRSDCAVPDRASDTDDPATLLPGEEGLSLVRVLVERLRPEDRVVVDAAGAGRSLRAIASAVGQSHIAVRARLLHLQAHFAAATNSSLNSWPPSEL